MVKIIDNHQADFINYHKLKTRKAGSMKHIDFHITVPYNMTIGEAHEIVGQIKKDMSDSLSDTRVSIHLDPYVDPKS